MKILLTIHHELDPNAGAPGSVLQLGHTYRTLGHTVQHYAFDNLPAWLPNVASGVFFPQLLATRLTKMCSEQRLDVIDASTGDAWFWGSFLRRQSRQLPLLVTHSHGLEHIAHLELLEEARRGTVNLSWKYPFYHGGYRLWEVSNSLYCADVVLMLNQRDADYAIETLHVPAERVHIVSNGIPETFINLPFDPLSTFDDGELMIAQIGTYIPRKGIHYSTPALNEVLTNYPNVKVSLLGTGFSTDHIYADFSPVVRDRVRVIPRYTHEQLPDLLKNHQMLLFPSLSEGFPLALPEAMACGLAPIATHIPGPTEIIINQANGILIPTRNTQAITQALESLLQNRSELQRIRCNAYATAQNYDWTRVAQKRLAIYEDALAKRKVRYAA